MDGDDRGGASRVDQREGKEERDACRCEKIQSAAVSVGKEGEPGCQPPTPLQVSVTSLCSCVDLL